jgi:formate hydrogenlyase subunit 6/NADH:ubiquinone oxidoreductase subunit I
MSERYNKKGYKPPQMIDSLADECIACSFCEDICPELAIYVEEEVAA